MFGASQFPRPLICKSDHRCSVPLTTDGSGRKPSRTHKSKRTNVHHHQAHLLNILFQLVCKRDDENALDVVLEGRMKNRPEQTREMGRFYEDVHFKRTHLNTWKHAKIKQRTRRQNDSHVDKAALHNSTHLPTTQTAEKQGVVKTSVCSLEKEKKKMLTLLLSRNKRVQVVVLVGYNYQTARKSDESRGCSKNAGNASSTSWFTYLHQGENDRTWSTSPSVLRVCFSSTSSGRNSFFIDTVVRKE